MYPEGVKLLLGILLSFSLQSATLVRIQCGGTGGVDAQGNVWQADTGFTGGARWDATNQASMAALAPPYNTLRYSAYPAGASFSYVIAALPPTTTGGHYTVTLQFVEPNKTAPGQRVFSIMANGTPLVTNLDLFTVAPIPGALTPYSVSFPVVATGSSIQLVFTPSVGNAVISGIQVDSVDAPIITPATAVMKSCQLGIGFGGTSPIMGSADLVPSPFLAGTYQTSFCYNDGGSSRTIVAVRCWVDNDKSVATLNVASGKTGVSFLTAPVICSPDWALATLAQAVTLAPDDWLDFNLTVGGTIIQTTWVVTQSEAPVASPLSKDGMLRATIPLSKRCLNFSRRTGLRGWISGE